MLNKRKIFLTLTGIFQALATDEIDADDLKNALFFIIGKQAHLMDSSNTDANNEVHLYYALNPELGEKVRMLLARIVSNAETEGRAVFIDPTKASEHDLNPTEQFWHRLNLFLYYHSRSYIKSDCPVPIDRIDASRVADAIELSEIELDPIY